MSNPTISWTPVAPRMVRDGVLFSVDGYVNRGRIVLVKGGEIIAGSTEFELAEDTIGGSAYGNPEFKWGPVYLAYGYYEVDIIYASGDQEGETMLASDQYLGAFDY